MNRLWWQSDMLQSHASCLAVFASNIPDFGGL